MHSLIIQRDGADLICAIIGHLVGDYLLQNDWMALNKKKPSLEGFFACAIHAMIWTVCVCLFAGWPLQGTWWVGLCVFLPHFIQDRTSVVKFWMTRINRQPKFVEPPMAPWSIIVVDNVWHIVALWAVWRFLA